MPYNPNILSRLWQEIKRRKVIHVVIVYASAAFVIIELVNNVYETLGLPDWTPAFTLIILAIGFPLALIFSWIFDVTPQGLERTKAIENLKDDNFDTSHSISKRNQKLGKVINWGLIGIMVFMIGVYLITKSNVNTINTGLIKFSVVLPNGEFLDYQSRSSSVAISPDGSKFVYVSVRNGTSYIMLRGMDDLVATPMTGTEKAKSPFFSRDGNWIGFFADGYLKKVPILGGEPLTICETRAGYDGCWVDENTIIFADAFKRCLMQVPSSGGIPNQITSSLKFIQGKTEQSHIRPHVLPGGKEIMYTVTSSTDNVTIAAFSLETGERWNLVDPGCNGKYVSSGHLVYTWKGDLMAVPFDHRNMKVTGNPVMIIDGVLMDSWSCAHFSISDGGSLVYAPGDIVEPDDKLILVDTTEKYKILDLPVGRYQAIRFSPDGKQILINYLQENPNCWIYGLDRGTFRRFTEKKYHSYWPIWSPDGKSIAFNSNKYGGSALNLYLSRTDGNDPGERLTESDYHQQPQCWTNDGKGLIFSQGIHPETGLDIFLLQLDNKEVRPVLNSVANESHPNLSKDGRWLAYVSDQSGREDVFVCSFPDLSNIQQVSTDGGVEPLWDTDGRKLFFRDISGHKIMAVSTNVTEGRTMEFSKPHLVIEGNYKASTGPWGRNYDLSPAGKELLLISEAKLDSVPKQVNVVLNFQEELNDLVLETK